MNGNNLFQVLFTALRAKLTPLWTKFRLFTNLSFWQTKIFSKLTELFTKLFDVKPRDKKDYYRIGNWLVSKRLAFAVTIFIGVLSLCYIFVINPPSVFFKNGGIKTYSYRSIPLRFTEGEVIITGKSKYKAYQGHVEKGHASGQGSLFRPDGSLVYEGEFKNSKYNGDGKFYYPSGQMQYQGLFVDNLFEGEGTLFRENGSEEYTGNFQAGMKEGEGTLFDGSGNAVFTGNFSKDHLLYTDFPGKSTADVNKMYTGKSVVYTDDSYFMVYTADIDSIYYGSIDQDTLEGDVTIEGVYVLSDEFFFGGKEYQNVKDMEDVFDKKEYEGNSYVITPEAVAISTLNSKGKSIYGSLDLQTENTLDDVMEVKSFDKDFLVYLYTYSKDGIRYTFICKDRTGNFGMYLIEKME